ncbi:DNA double-strand break repair nuclease NurA [Myxococcota bacterium]|nr:DNA double-strand break repair nuclease NurA [Myxococcota bacterium]
MSYASKYGRRPPEYASKSSHQEIIKDKAVQSFLQQCKLPSTVDNVETDDCETLTISDANTEDIRHIIAIDGGYTEVEVHKKFPSARIAFFQFGILFFALEDLQNIHESKFIFPEQMTKIKNIERLKLALPTKGISAYGAASLTASVRETLHRFFLSEPSPEDSLAKSLKWLLFGEYNCQPFVEWSLASCPICSHRDITIRIKDITADYCFKCDYCENQLFLTDVFRLHEAIDDEMGASGILGYLTTLIEQIIIVYIIQTILKIKPALLKDICIIKDGPLAFFGQTANLHKPMRKLICWLKDHHDIFLIGSEKSGAFVEHADAISTSITPGSAMILNNDYIYRYIIPGKADPNRPYGSTTYYGSKVIYKTSAGRMYVVTLPTRNSLVSPRASDLFNLKPVLNVITQLRCDMYDSALIPIAIVNKLVSLSNHPSSRILEKFARTNVKS